MGPIFVFLFFPTNPARADILDDAEFDFENSVLRDYVGSHMSRSLDFKFLWLPDFQISSSGRSHDLLMQPNPSFSQAIATFELSCPSIIESLVF